MANLFIGNSQKLALDEDDDDAVYKLKCHHRDVTHVDHWCVLMTCDIASP